MRNSLLVIVDSDNSQNHYGPYIGEILRSEGFNGFCTMELADVNADMLNLSGVVILTRCSVNQKQISLFSNYVNKGGSLLTIQPEPLWAPIIGLIHLPTGQLDGYLRILPHQLTGEGFRSESMQFHGWAQHWSCKRAAPLALLYYDSVTPNTYPAIAIHAFGKGKIVTFTYDIGESIAGIRQGNPRLAGHKTDGMFSPRPGDLFGAGWIDTAKEHLPQADIQQDFLARIVEFLNPYPLPRLWYLPGEAKTILILTADGEASPQSYFYRQIEAAERYGAHMTFYLKEDTQITPNDDSAWRRRGHDTSFHPFAGENPTLALMEEAFSRQAQAFEGKFGHASSTVRCHWLQWYGYVDQARLWAKLGVRMDFNYVSSRPSKGMYLTGSGRPLHFVSETGEILSVWQQPTQLEDDLLLYDSEGHNRQYSLGMSADDATLLSKRLLTQSMSYYHTPVVMNVHPNFFVSFSSSWLQRTLAFAQEKKIPVWSARKWLDFVEMRSSVETNDLMYRESKLTFSLSNIPPQNDLTLVLPYEYEGKTVRSVTRGGQSSEFTRRKIHHREVVFINLDGGEEPDFVVIYA